MKKSIFLLSFLISALGYSQVLEDENFNSYPNGTITDWYVVGNPAPVLEALPLNGEKVLKVTVPYSHVPNIVEIQKNQNFQNLWNNRQVGNNIIKGEIDILNSNIYMAGSIGVFDTNGQQIVGIWTGSASSNGPIYGTAKVVKKSDNTVTTYDVMLSNSSSNPVKISYTYNSETGEVSWKTPTNTYILNSSNPQYNVIPNQSIKENKIRLELIHMSSASLTIDNYKTEAISDAALNTSEHTIVKNNKISIYPNPSKDYINIDAKNIKSIEIMDMTGRVVDKPAVSSSVNISNLSSGNYMIKVTTDNFTTTEKIIKK
ncbi:T9SS type A sorting domain-containing protein [Chryseobacterium oncorhynchi]|uniref:Secretion system C-terminal sorting domain-containing protein n=1 Tax=Chryseobacterium oncorhynchi TaxID=741074 RepID=A0A316X353_9FLAO|nr:T9SS type A sorting domain-containing protein [Chryseobacterium oncorhynchi]PWN67729.1 hypothetical protein C1638_003800 [Chryseobacterium oncorhynchi]